MNLERSTYALGLVLSALNLNPYDTESLGRLVERLKLLISSIDFPNDEWARQFDDRWWELEIVYAENLDKELSLLTTDNLHLIEQTLSALRDSTDSLLLEFNTHKDLSE